MSGLHPFKPYDARQLFIGYVRHHQNGSRMLFYMGALGVCAYPVLYALRFFSPQPLYDDLSLTIVNVLLSLLLLQVGWPARLRRFYMHFSYVALTFMLPFSFMFVALKNHGGAIALSNCMMAVFLVILLTDWRNAIVCLGIGFTTAVVAYLVFDPSPVWPKDFLERAPVVVVLGIAAGLIKTALEKTTRDRTEKLERKQRESRVAVIQETIGFLSHELNTPLAEVRILVGGIREMYVDRPQADPPYVDSFEVGKVGDVLAMLDRVERRAGFAQDMVQRFMRSAYYVRWEHPPQSLTATSLIASLLEKYPFPHDKRPAFVDVVTGLDFTIAGSRELLEMVLGTLTHNSLLALRDQPAPRLVYEIAGNLPGEPGGIIRVTDNGCGVPPDVLSRLTRETVPSGWKNRNGGGMGLMFSQRVLEAMCGSISVESMVGKGTSVTLTFRDWPQTDDALRSWKPGAVPRPQPEY